MSNITVNINGGVVDPNSLAGDYSWFKSPTVAATAAAVPAPTTAPPLKTTFPPATTFVPIPPVNAATTTKEEMALISQAEREYIESLKYNERVKAYAATTDETPAFLTPQKKINYVKIFVIWVFAFLLIFLFQFSCSIMPRFPCRILVALVLLVAVIWTFWLVFSPPKNSLPPPSR